MSDTPKTPPVTNQPQDDGAKFCHRFMIPTSWAEQSGQASVMNPHPPMIMKQQMGFVLCIEHKCMRWNKAQRDCRDNVDSDRIEQATFYLASIAKGIDDFNAGSEE